jgi:methionyl-tRNA formyltransferase
MNARTQDRAPLLIVFFGMRCAFSIPPLSALFDAGHEIVAVVLPGPSFGPPVLRQQSPSSLPMLRSNANSSEIDVLAAKAGATVLTIGDLTHKDTLAAIADFQPDVIATACFPDLLPPEVLSIPRLGTLNVHPSLLPRWRGPEPLFWTFREGDQTSGVTIHLMDGNFDTGPILMKERLDIPDGIRLPEFEQRLAELGGALLVNALDALVSQRIQPEPQNDSQATIARFTRPADYLVPTDRPAQWAYNFVRAIAPTSDQLTVRIAETNELFRVLDAIEIAEGASIDRLYELTASALVAQFQDGTVMFQLRPSEL